MRPSGDFCHRLRNSLRKPRRVLASAILHRGGLHARNAPAVDLHHRMGDARYILAFSAVDHVVIKAGEEIGSQPWAADTLRRTCLRRVRPGDAARDLLMHPPSRGVLGADTAMIHISLCM